MINALSIDLEDWYQVPLAKISDKNWSLCKPAIGSAVQKIRNFLKTKKIKLTIFASGYIAEKHPDIIYNLFKDGHEIESHGYWHRLAYKQSENEFEEDIQKSINIIAKITKRRPVGYRSPSWSTTRVPDRAARILLKHKFIYDSSLFPTKNFLYGDMKYKSEIYFYKNTKLLEIPPSTIDILNLKIPVTGGFYLRVIPISLMKKLMQIRNKKGPSHLYFHPWEVEDSYPRMKIPLLHSFIQYYGCGNMLEKLDILTKHFQFGSIQEVYPLNRFKRFEG